MRKGKTLTKPLIVIAMLCAALTACKGKTVPDETKETDISVSETEPVAEDSAKSQMDTDSESERDDIYRKYKPQKDLAVQALSHRLSEEKESLYVYRDYSDQANHFAQRAKIFGRDEAAVKDMDENWTDNPYSGESCIRCEIKTHLLDWGGWMFMTGYLPEGETVPKLNTGEEPGQGIDLTGANSLQFYARGEEGGETVEFFTCGFGYNAESGVKAAPYPDSTKKHSLGFVTLSDQWESYKVPLNGEDLSYIVCGFGYVCSGDKGIKSDNIFYLDEIQFTGDIASVKEAPMLMRSYDTDSIYMKNTAFSYDNALAAMAFLSEDRKEEAREILDAFVYAIEHDRYQPGRVRNAYAAGDIRPVPGWGTAASLPGWYDREKKEWFEDQYQVGCNVGNTSYVALALLQYDAAYGDETYFNTAKTLMDWVIENCSDKTPGFTAGYDGWPEGKQPVVYDYTYKSIEHNIDAYAALKRLHEKTGDDKYRDAAKSALSFIQSMYDTKEDVFYTGTGNDGVTAEKENIVLDAQVWSAMALGNEFEDYSRCLDRVKGMSVDGAYPFCEANKNGGWWAEGTAFTALMFREQKDDDTAFAALDQLCGIQLENGLFPAASVENLSTGIYLFTGEPWEYGTDPHIVPAAWFIMAVNGWNPYQM